MDFTDECNTATPLPLDPSPLPSAPCPTPVSPLLNLPSTPALPAVQPAKVSAALLIVQAADRVDNKIATTAVILSPLLPVRTLHDRGATFLEAKKSLFRSTLFPSSKDGNTNDLSRIFTLVHFISGGRRYRYHRWQDEGVISSLQEMGFGNWRKPL